MGRTDACLRGLCAASCVICMPVFAPGVVLRTMCSICCFACFAACAMCELCCCLVVAISVLLCVCVLCKLRVSCSRADMCGSPAAATKEISDAIPSATQSGHEHTIRTTSELTTATSELTATQQLQSSQQLHSSQQQGAVQLVDNAAQHTASVMLLPTHSFILAVRHGNPTSLPAAVAIQSSS